MREGKERIIYDCYDLFDDENIEAAKEYLMEENDYDSEEDISDTEIQDEIYSEDEADWDAAKFELEHGLENPYGYLVVGTCGLWNGNFAAGHECKDFYEMTDAFEDCVYIRIYDVDGHLFLKGTTHDGTSEFEVKELTKTGKDLLDRWNYYQYGEGKSEREIHKMLWNNNLYTRLPHFSHRVYGCPKRESVKKSEVA